MLPCKLKRNLLHLYVSDTFRGLNRFPGLISCVVISNINHCNIQLSGYHRTSRMRKPKPESYRKVHLFWYSVLHIHGMHVHKRGFGAFGKVRAVTRPLKIHVALEQFGLTYPMPVPFQPNSFSFIIRFGRLPSSRAEINILGEIHEDRKIADGRERGIDHLQKRMHRQEWI